LRIREPSRLHRRIAPEDPARIAGEIQPVLILGSGAQAGIPYHLWMRGKADKNNWANDSVFAQFSGTVTASGSPVYRIGTTSATWYSVEDGTNAGLAGWGWNDDSYDGLAAPLYFATTGPQTIRVQVREDGLSIDQIVLSAGTYLTASPGLFKNDTTILPR
jgi:hypothetical protein